MRFPSRGGQVSRRAVSTHPTGLIRLRAALDTWLVETGDQGVWPEPDKVVEKFEQEMHEWFGTPSWYSK